jgi:4-amino-4-deoxy-L-arabinose transferase-like glycosyltransferase
MLPRLALPPKPGTLALIALAFVLPGLAGHDLWKTHDAIGLGIVHDMATSGTPLIPRIAGTPWLFDPPLYHWLALGFGAVFQYVLEFHSGARLASGALILVSFWLIYLAAWHWAKPREERGKDGADEERRVHAAAAMLVLLGSIGLIVHAHEALPELAALTAMCGALAVLPHATRKPFLAGALFGAALGLAALSAVWIAPVSLLAAVIAAHVVWPEWRTRRAFVFLAMAVAVAAAISSSWPLALAWRAPEAFETWRAVAWQPLGAPLANLRYFLATGSWFAWPAWPLALWAAWSLRRRWNEPQLFVPAVSSVLILLLAAYWGPAQDVHLIPALAPLALLGYQGALCLRRGAAGALDWFGVLGFGFFGLLLWFCWFAMMTGVPPRFANNFFKTAPGFTPEFKLLYVALALAFAAGWVYLVFFTTRSPMRSLLRWAAGIVLLWGTGAMLLMPWADYQKSYRSVALQLRSKIPVGSACIAQKSLGVSQAAALDYHGGIRARPFDLVRPNACPLLLVQGHPKHEFDGPGAGWVKLADVGRPGDRAERYRLYRLSK